jgi:hypothetical protein
MRFSSSHRQLKGTIQAMKKEHLLLWFLVLLSVILGGSTTRVNAAGLGPDILYVGDAGDNTVKRFSTANWSSLDGSKGVFVKGASLTGPRGVLIAGSLLVVINQNVNQPQPGAVLQYFLNTGSFAAAWVAQSDPNAPFVPRGAVIKNGVIYVANFVADTLGTKPGQVQAFAGDGKLLGQLTPGPTLASKFRPRGIVIGPDGLLYVSSVPNFDAPSPPGAGPTIGGQVLTFDPNTLDLKGTFIDDAGGNGQLNRPEALVFGPDGRLYVTSFRATPEDTDSIRIYNGPASLTPGQFAGAIVLDDPNVPNGARVFAEAMIFGPGGKLFVPISGNDPSHRGEVRTYNVTNNPPTLEAVVVPAGTLIAPWYLTFGRTNSATLSYGN